LSSDVLEVTRHVYDVRARSRICRRRQPVFFAAKKFAVFDWKRSPGDCPAAAHVKGHMKKIGCMVILWLACLAAIHGSTQAQTNVVTAAHFNCIVYNATTCPPALENYSGLATLAIVAGYTTPGDGGGGQYVTGTACPDFPNSMSPPTPAGVFTAGSNTINNVANTPGVVVGSIINATGYVTTGTEIAAVSSTQIVMTEPAIQSTPMGSTTNFTVTGSNGGTVIRATTTGGTPLCFYKTDYRGDPHEFGAAGDGSTPDTTAIQSWLGAYGNVTNPASHHAPTNFGPWIATIPANYLVTLPLVCPPSATLQAQANLWAGAKSSGSPAIRIFSNTANWLGGTGVALLTMNDNCRLSGFAIDATNLNPLGAASGVDAVDIVGREVAIDNHSLIENGFIDINCDVSGGNGVGLQVKESQVLNAATDNILIGQNCADVRLIGDIITGAGNRGVAFYGADMTLADGVVEQSNGVGIDLETANLVSISANLIDHNGKSPPSPPLMPSQPTNIFINGGNHISICGNHIQGGGDSVPTTAGQYSSQIYLENSIDNFSLCGNVYTANTGHTDVIYTPQYVFDAPAGPAPGAPPGATLTNSSINESPETQAVGVYSPNTAPLLPQLAAPRAPTGFISGLTLSNSGLQSVNIAPGEASDSSGAASIVLPVTCPVNMATNGIGGLDAGNIAPSTTYYFYVIANPGGGNPNCMASTNATAPVFTDHSFHGTGYRIAIKGSTTYGYNAVVNANTIGGAAVNNTLSTTDAGVTAFTNAPIGSFATASPVTLGVSGMPSQPVLYYTCSSCTLYYGMQITDTQNCIQPNTIIESFSASAGMITLSQNLGSCTLSAATAYASVAQEIVLSGATASSNNANTDITIYAGIYRLVGALYTDSSSNVVKFTQDGDTFYLSTSPKDIPSPTCIISDSSAHSCRLSVPCGLAPCSTGQGVHVEAFGRVLGGTSSSQLLVSSLDQSDQAPTPFSTSAPGYTTQNSGGETSFPFRLFTDLNLTTGTSTGSVRVRANALSGSTTVYEVTDGWVFHRN
jgi:hypothetical protein